AALVPPGIGAELCPLVAGLGAARLALHVVDHRHEEIDAADAVALRIPRRGGDQRWHARVAGSDLRDAAGDVRPLAGEGRLVADVVEQRRRGPTLALEVIRPRLHHRPVRRAVHADGGELRALQAGV